MSTIRLPTGETFDAEYACLSGATHNFVAKFSPGADASAIADSMAGAGAFEVVSERETIAYSGYTKIKSVRRISDGSIITLKRGESA